MSGRSGRPRHIPSPAVPARPRSDLVLGFVHPGQVSSYFHKSMMGTMLYDRASDQRIIGVLDEWSSANVSNARNKIVRRFLDEFEADWLLFIDADMAWEANAPHQLLAVANPGKAPIVGGLCFGSAEDKLFPTIYTLVLLEDGQPMTMRLTDYPDDTMFGCQATGAAFLMIHRSVLVRMREHGFNDAFPWFQETQLGDQPVSEDITFCLRAGQILGFPIHVHTGVRIGHHKTTVLRAETFRAQQASEPVPEAANVDR